MPTVHKIYRIPAELNEALNRKSQELGMGQSQGLVRALELGLLSLDHPELRGGSLKEIFAQVTKAKEILEDISKRILEIGGSNS